MSNAALETAIEAAWDARDTITSATTGETRAAIEDTLNALDSGALRVAEKQDDGSWHVNQWAKKAVLLGFRLKDMELQGGSAQGGGFFNIGTATLTGNTITGNKAHGGTAGSGGLPGLGQGLGHPRAARDFLWRQYETLRPIGVAGDRSMKPPVPGPHLDLKLFRESDVRGIVRGDAQARCLLVDRLGGCSTQQRRELRQELLRPGPGLVQGQGAGAEAHDRVQARPVQGSDVPVDAARDRDPKISLSPQ